MKRAPVLIASLTTVAAAVALLMAQERRSAAGPPDAHAAPPAPVEVTIEGFTAGRFGREVNLKFTNTSERRVVACAVKVDLYDDKGRPTGNRSLMITAGLGESTVRNSFAPGEVWYAPFQIDAAPGGTRKPIESYNPRLVYVRFKAAEGDQGVVNWGPDMNDFSCQLTGAMGAYKTERGRLRDLLRQGGPAAVVADLTAEPAP